MCGGVEIFSLKIVDDVNYIVYEIN